MYLEETELLFKTNASKRSVMETAVRAETSLKTDIDILLPERI
jgi:hypothetical protein